MNPHHRIIPVALLALLLGSSVHAQVVTVSDVNPSRGNFEPNFYGSNGQDRGGFDWTQAKFQTSLGTLNLGILRFASGTGSGYWDWKAGNFLSFGAPVFATPGTSGTSPQNPNLAPFSPLSELQTEIQKSGAKPLFVLNLLTDPSVGQHVDALDNQGSIPLPNSTSPAFKYQLDSSTGIIAKSPVNIPFFELGNEYYGGGPSSENGKNDYPAVYPGAGYDTYGPVANQWLTAIHNQTTATVAAVGADRAQTTGARKLNWDAGVIPLLTNLQGGDAITIHPYANANVDPAQKSQPGPAGQTQMGENLIGSGFAMFADVKTNDFAPTGPIPASLHVWMTEYNIDSTSSSIYYGTWAHGLALAAMSLKYLEIGQIHMMVHHCVVGSAAYGDIFETTTGLNGVSPNSWTNNQVPTNTSFGLTAGGLVSQFINTAAIGQNQATQIAFSFPSGIPSSYSVTDYADGTPFGSTTIPTLYGWQFSSGTAGSYQAVILNLSSTDCPVNLSGIVASGKWAQASSSNPWVFVTDGAADQAVKVDGTQATTFTSQPLSTLTAAQIKKLVLPAFSITRLVYTHN